MACPDHVQEVVLSEMTPELATRLSGPSWLVDRRVAAARAARDISMPTTGEEAWRYSRIDELDLEGFKPVDGTGPAAVSNSGIESALASMGELDGVVVVRNGAIVRCELAETAAQTGVTLGPVAEEHEVLFDHATEPVDLFACLNDAYTLSPLVLDVPAGAQMTQPVAVLDWLDAEQVAIFPRLVVRLGEGAVATLIEWHGGSDVSAFAAPVTALEVGRSATLRHIAVQGRGAATWQIASQVTRVERDATFHSYQAALGGDYARSRVDCRLQGKGASGDLSAVYFGTGGQMLDFRTFQHHEAPDTTSNLLFKGALGGSSKSVYTGLIKVHKGARGSNAFQTNRNLKLSDDAWAESVPNLEIENNDVRCSHASTVGPVDEDQRFYLESRGVPTPVADRLIVAGFFDEVLEGLPVPGVAESLRDGVRVRLDHLEVE